MKTFKIVMIGNSNVGKTSIQNRFADNYFSNLHEMTIGVEFASKIMTINGIDIKVHLWDTAGQEVFRSICRSYYRGADCAIIVYDVSNVKSFYDIKTWIKDLRSYTDNTQWIVVGNKSDLKCNVSQKEIDELNIDHIFVSAKNNENIHEIFETVLKKKMAQYSLEEFSEYSDLSFNNIKLRNSKRVCTKPKCC